MAEYRLGSQGMSIRETLFVFDFDMESARQAVAFSAGTVGLIQMIPIDRTYRE